MLNIFPYNNGHVMIAPLRHARDFTQLNEGEALDLFQALNKAKRLLDKVLKPEGYNIGINISKSAGAGIRGHMHIHIVPRWIGDANFMPVIYNTKIISQSLDQLCKKLKNAESKTN
jgi:ATP adenylyltransferase